MPGIRYRPNSQKITIGRTLTIRGVTIPLFTGSDSEKAENPTPDPDQES